MKKVFFVRFEGGRPYMLVTVKPGGTDFQPLSDDADDVCDVLESVFVNKPITKNQLDAALDEDFSIEGPMTVTRETSKTIKEFMSASETPRGKQIDISAIKIKDLGEDNSQNLLNMKARAFIYEQTKSTFNYEVKRVRAVWDPSLSIPGTNRRGGWRCPTGTRYGGQITDRFGRNCGWGVARRIANAITNIGERLESLDDRRRGRRVDRRNQRVARRLRRDERGGAAERGLRGIAEALDGGATSPTVASPSAPEAPRAPEKPRGRRRVFDSDARDGGLRESERRRVRREIEEPGAARTGEIDLDDTVELPEGESMPDTRSFRNVNNRFPKNGLPKDAYWRRDSYTGDDKAELERRFGRYYDDKNKINQRGKFVNERLDDFRKRQAAPRKKPEPRKKPRGKRKPSERPKGAVEGPLDGEAFNDYADRKYDEYKKRVEQIRRDGGNAGLLTKKEWFEINQGNLREAWDKKNPEKKKPEPRKKPAPRVKPPVAEKEPTPKPESKKPKNVDYKDVWDNSIDPVPKRYDGVAEHIDGLPNNFVGIEQAGQFRDALNKIGNRLDKYDDDDMVNLPSEAPIRVADLKKNVREAAKAWDRFIERKEDEAVVADIAKGNDWGEGSMPDSRSFRNVNNFFPKGLPDKPFWRDDTYDKPNKEKLEKRFGRYYDDDNKLTQRGRYVNDKLKQLRDEGKIAPPKRRGKPKAKAPEVAEKPEANVPEAVKEPKKIKGAELVAIFNPEVDPQDFGGGPDWVGGLDKPGDDDEKNKQLLAQAKQSVDAIKMVEDELKKYDDDDLMNFGGPKDVKVSEVRENIKKTLAALDKYMEGFNKNEAAPKPKAPKKPGDKKKLPAVDRRDFDEKRINADEIHQVVGLSDEDARLNDELAKHFAEAKEDWFGVGAGEEQEAQNMAKLREAINKRMEREQKDRWNDDKRKGFEKELNAITDDAELDAMEKKLVEGIAYDRRKVEMAVDDLQRIRERIAEKPNLKRIKKDDRQDLLMEADRVIVWDAILAEKQARLEMVRRRKQDKALPDLGQKIADDGNKKNRDFVQQEVVNALIQVSPNKRPGDNDLNRLIGKQVLDNEFEQVPERMNPPQGNRNKQDYLNNFAEEIAAGNHGDVGELKDKIKANDERVDELNRQIFVALQNVNERRFSDDKMEDEIKKIVQNYAERDILGRQNDVMRQAITKKPWENKPETPKAEDDGESAETLARLARTDIDSKELSDSEIVDILGLRDDPKRIKDIADALKDAVPADLDAKDNESDADWIARIEKEIGDNRKQKLQARREGMKALANDILVYGDQDKENRAIDKDISAHKVAIKEMKEKIINASEQLESLRELRRQRELTKGEKAKLKRAVEDMMTNVEDLGGLKVQLEEIEAHKKRRKEFWDNGGNPPKAGTDSEKTAEYSSPSQIKTFSAATNEKFVQPIYKDSWVNKYNNGRNLDRAKGEEALKFIVRVKSNVFPFEDDGFMLIPDEQNQGKWRIAKVSELMKLDTSQREKFLNDNEGIAAVLPNDAVGYDPSDVLVYEIGGDPDKNVIDADFLRDKRLNVENWGAYEAVPHREMFFKKLDYMTSGNAQNDIGEAAARVAERRGLYARKVEITENERALLEKAKNIRDALGILEDVAKRERPAWVENNEGKDLTEEQYIILGKDVYAIPTDLLSGFRIALRKEYNNPYVAKVGRVLPLGDAMRPMNPIKNKNVVIPSFGEEKVKPLSKRRPDGNMFPHNNNPDFDFGVDFTDDVLGVVKPIDNPEIKNEEDAVKWVADGKPLSQVPRQYWAQAMRRNSSYDRQDTTKRFRRVPKNGGMIGITEIYALRDEDGFATNEGVVLKASASDDNVGELVGWNLMHEMGILQGGAARDGRDDDIGLDFIAVPYVFKDIPRGNKMIELQEGTNGMPNVDSNKVGGITDKEAAIGGVVARVNNGLFNYFLLMPDRHDQNGIIRRVETPDGGNVLHAIPLDLGWAGRSPEGIGDPLEYFGSAYGDIDVLEDIIDDAIGAGVPRTDIENAVVEAMDASIDRIENILKLGINAFVDRALKMEGGNIPTQREVRQARQIFLAMKEQYNGIIQQRADFVKMLGIRNRNLKQRQKI